MVDKRTYPSDTECVHAGVVPDQVTGSMLTNIVQSTAFKQHSVERYQESGYTYSRSANPTVSAFETKVAKLEGSELPAINLGTGMAAFHCLMSSIVKSGDHVIITRCSYGGTNRAARVLYANQYGVDVEFVDFTNLDAIRKAVKPGKTRMILSETPCNPVLELADLQAISDIAQNASIKNPPKIQEDLKDGDGPSRQCLSGRVIHVTDSTLAPPPMMRGLDFGVDIVLVSLTKYYCGHNMHLGGALITRDKELYEHLRFKQNVMGSIMTPMAAYSMMQTAKTLHLRIRKQSENAMKVAQFLEKHKKVDFVTYPGLPSHKQHEIALRQHRENMHGGMVAFEVKGGSEAGRRVMNACTPPWTLAENLGAVESILTCPSVFTHGNMPREARLAVGITDGLIRLSIGIEDADDLISGLDKALEAA